MAGGIERVEIDFSSGRVVVFGHSEVSKPIGQALPTSRLQSPFPRSPIGEKRKIRAPEKGVPGGTIDSLRPLIQPAFSQYGLDQDYAYWQELSDNAPYVPEEACKLLDKSDKGPLDVAKAVLAAEPQTKRMMDFGDITPDMRGYITATLAWEILGHYPKESREKWQEQIQDYEQNLQPQKV